MKHIVYLFLVLSPFVAQSQTQNFWTKKNDFTGLKRTRAASFVVENHGYVSGGVDTSETVLNDLWQYDPVMDTWAQMASLPGSVRRDAIAFSIGTKGYLGTGIDSSEAQSGNTLADFYEYNPTTNTWTQKSDFPGFGGQGIYFATGFNIDSKGYLCGGKIGPNNYSSQLWEYKPSNDSWTLRAPFPGGVRYQLCSFVIGYNAFVGLGTDQDIYRKDIWRYSAGTNQWSQCADLPGAERGGTATFVIGLRGFVCGGTNGGFLDDTWEYNPFSNSWSVRAPFGGSERKNAIFFALNNKGYVGTGSGFSGKKESIHEYTPYESVFLEIKEKTNVDFSIFPNPASSYFTVTGNYSGRASIDVVSLSGKVVLKKEVEMNEKVALDKSQVQSGIYLIFLKNEKDEVIGTHKINIL